MNSVRLAPEKLIPGLVRDERVQSYNIEMTELAGGTFWKPYTAAQVAGDEPFEMPSSKEKIIEFLMSQHVPVPAIDLYEPRIRTCAAGLGKSIVRYSGSWATRTYFDYDDSTNGLVPDGFDFVLTRSQWKGAVDFAKAVGAEILVSVANSYGVHENGTGRWLPDQAEALWSYTAELGGSIAYAEFMNEPNLLSGMKLPEGYSPADFVRDHDLFAEWLAEKHPETQLVALAAADLPRSSVVGTFVQMFKSTDFLDHMKHIPNLVSYHSYTGISERGQLFGLHYPAEKALDEDYLALTMQDLEYWKELSARYVKDAELWVTESADAGCGGNTWAPTFLETFRYLDEMCRFCASAKGIIFHNTLASSAYGLLDPETHQPRPQYWAAYLFERLCGTQVYDTQVPVREGVHLYAFSRADGKAGNAWVYINNSRTEQAEIVLPASGAEVYVLSSDGLRSTALYLNGKKLALLSDTLLAEPVGKPAVGELVLAPCSIAFIMT